MTRIDSTRVKWRVQWRLSRKHKWMNAGLFETRQDAREDAEWRRIGAYDEDSYWTEGVGFGNTRTVRHISGKGKA